VGSMAAVATVEAADTVVDTGKLPASCLPHRHVQAE